MTLSHSRRSDQNRIVVLADEVAGGEVEDTDHGSAQSQHSKENDDESNGAK